MTAADPSIPLSPDELRDRLLWRVAHLGSALSGAVILGFTVYYVISGQWVLAALESLALVGIVGCYLWARRTGRANVAVHGLAAGNWLVLIVIVVVQGGLTSPGIAWLMLLPPLAMLAGFSWAWPMAIATAMLMFGLYAAQELDALPPPAEIPALQRAVSSALIVTLVSLFAYYALRWRTRLADELAAARDAALEANRLKDRFIAHLNHEIRTPMNALLASAELLATRHAAPGDRPLVSALRESAEHLRSLVDDVLDLARLQAGAMVIDSRPLALSPLLEGVRDMFGPAALAKGLHFTVAIEPGTPACWRGDALRIRQVLVNLVSNAIKMTEAGEVGLRASAPQGGPLVLEVRDSGPGITPALRERLFSPYAQGELKTEQRAHSSGLGLAICRELVEAMGGRIGVDSAPGEGAVFRVSLPLRAEDAPVPADADTTPAAVSPGEGRTPVCRVLLVEDDEVNRLVMAALLDDMGVEAVAAADGPAALARLDAERFDAVLMDCQLPGFDGLQVTQRWRAIEASRGLARVPVIALTGNVDAASRAACLASGMDTLLGKPVSRQALARALGGTRTDPAASPVAPLVETA